MQTGRRALLGLALLGGVSRVLPALARPAASLDAELAALAADPACQLASVSVVAIRAGQVVYAHQLGRRIIEGAGGPAVTSRTMFRVASVSKLITTLGVMRLVEDGKLALDDDVGVTLGFPLRNPHYPDRPVTLRMLLTHTASLRDGAGYFWGPERALKDVLLPGTPGLWSDQAAPGDYFSYCNLNWGIIGTLMERATGERFDRLMKRLILDPLGLRGGFHPAELSAAELADLAILYRKRPVDSEVWAPDGPWVPQVDDYRSRPPAPVQNYVIGTNATPFSPAGGLRISAGDLGTIMRMLINHGVHEGKPVLRPESLARMFTRQWTYDGKGGNGDNDAGLYHAWGLGNQQFLDEPGTGRQVVAGGGFSGVGHLGFAYGLHADFIVDLKRGDGLVVLIGGTSADPGQHHGSYSALSRPEERILTALYRGALA